MSKASSFRYRPESGKTNSPRSGQKYGAVSLCEKFFNQLDSGLCRNDER